MSDSKRLRFIQKGFEHYTGMIGQYRFEDGVSVDAIPQIDRDRMSAAGNFMEIDEDGTEHRAGAAQRMVKGRANVAPVVEKPKKQTEEEKAEEQIQALLKARKQYIRKTHTKDELEGILKTSGVGAVRAVGEEWGVKDKKVVVLIEKILDAQEKWRVKKEREIAELEEKISSISAEARERMEKMARDAELEAIAENGPVPAEPEKVDEQTADKLAAAVTGDLSAAVSTEEKTEEETKPAPKKSTRSRKPKES